MEHALSGLPAWNNRILIGITNPFAKAVPAYVMDELDGRSASTIVADFASGPCVVKTISTILMTTAKKVHARRRAPCPVCVRRRRSGKEPGKESNRSISAAPSLTRPLKAGRRPACQSGSTAVCALAPKG